MPTCQTVVFENVEIDVSNNKQLFIHPIHRVISPPKWKCACPEDSPDAYPIHAQSEAKCPRCGMARETGTALGAFPVNIDFAILSCCYDLRPGTYGCTHSFWAPDKKKKLIEFKHEGVRLDTDGGGMGFRTTFENVMIESPGRYWIRTEVSGGMKADEVLIRIEEQTAPRPIKLKA